MSSAIDERLSQFVRDQHDCVSRVGKAAHPAKEFLDFIRRENGRWLVEYQHVRIACERFDNLEALLRAHAQISRARSRVEREARAHANLSHSSLGIQPRNARVPRARRSRRRSSPDVREMLMHHPDPPAIASAGDADVLRSAAGADTLRCPARGARTRLASASSFRRRSRRGVRAPFRRGRRATRRRRRCSCRTAS